MMSWSDDPEGQELIKELSRDIVAEVAPEEQDIFEPLIQEYFADSASPDALSKAKEKHDPLSFGLDGFITVTTPIVAAMVVEVLGYVFAEILISSQQDRVNDLIAKGKSLFKPGSNDHTGGFSATKQQLREMKRIASQQAEVFGLDSVEADKLADTIIGRLALLD